MLMGYDKHAGLFLYGQLKLPIFCLLFKENNFSRSGVLVIRAYRMQVKLNEVKVYTLCSNKCDCAFFK